MFHVFTLVFGKPYLAVGFLLASVVVAAFTVNDVASFGAAFIVVSGIAYWSLWSIKSTLDRVNEGTWRGRCKRLVRQNGELKEAIEAKDVLIESQRDMIEELRGHSDVNSSIE